MPTVFVHGITVREDRFNELLKRVRNGFTKRRADAVVDGFYWGDMASSLRYDGASIPGFISEKRGFDDWVATTGDETQLAMLLLDEPLLELRLVRDAEDFNPFAGYDAPQEVEERNQRLEAARPQVATAIAEQSDLRAAAGAAVSEVDAEKLVAECFDAAGRADRTLGIVDLIDPLCRAITASIYRLVEGDTPKLDQRFQWLAVETQVQVLLEQEFAGERGWVGDKLSGLAGGAASRSVTFAMKHGLRKRVMQSTALFVGDVLAYMAKRNQVQAALEKLIVQSLAASPGPLTLVGHSLGGIICFDYCLNTTRDIELLITVGSQVGLFAELGAFPTLVAGPDNKLTTPQVIETWINVYDPNDILSFLSAPVLTRVKDVDFNTKAPFPAAHSEYWNQAALYEQLLP